MNATRILAAAAALLAALPFASSPLFAQPVASPYTSAARYDVMRRVTGTIAPDPDGAGGSAHAAVRNTYDQAGRLTKVENGELAAWQSETVAPSSWAGFTVYRSLETTYDLLGRKTRESVREGSGGTTRTVTQYSYDLSGRPECTAVRLNPADFDAPPSSACAQGTGGADRITRTVYDAAGQRLQVREGVGTSIEAAEATWAYNLNGQITTVVDGNGNRAALVYDGHGRQICWMFPSTTRPVNHDDATPASALATAGALSGTIEGGQCASGNYEAYGYDPNGNRTSLRKRDGSTLSFQYDALGQMTVKTVPERLAPHPYPLTAAQTRNVYYGYDLRGLQTFARFDSATGEGITNAYDGLGRLASSTTNMGGTTRTLSYQYDRNGNRTRITHPDDVYFTSTYDGLNRPFQIFDQTSAWRAWFAYKYHGAPYAAIRANGVNDFWEYDGAQRLYSHGLYFNAPYAASTAIWLYSHNAAPQLASVWRDNDAYAWTRAHNATRPHATNGLNQYATTGLPGTLGSVAFTYDDNGNLASETPWSFPPTGYTYDIENRLVGRSHPTGNVTLSYDPLGRLYEVTLGANTTRFLYDGDALVAEYDAAGTMTRRYVHNVGADVPLLSYAGAGLGQPAYLHADHQNSIIAVSDSVGAGTVNTYDEYGIPGLGNSGRFQYTGQIWLPEIGMSYYKARFYSPTLGRFLQTDPIGFQDRFNLYAYVGNDPINFVDHTGREAWLVSRGTRYGPTHSFVVVAPNLGGRVQHRFSYGPDGTSFLGGNLIYTTHSGDMTDIADANAWRLIGSDPAAAARSGVSVSRIDANDAVVVRSGREVNRLLGTHGRPGPVGYDFWVDGNGAYTTGNSNTAAYAVANMAGQYGRRSRYEQADPYGSRNLGASSYGNITRQVAARRNPWVRDNIGR